MKFIIKHEIPGRIRVHMVQPKMTFEEADILLYYLVNLENVTKAKYMKETQDAVDLLWKRTGGKSSRHCRSLGMIG